MSGGDVSFEVIAETREIVRRRDRGDREALSRGKRLDSVRESAGWTGTRSDL
jgi:hypothetical protein